MRRVLAEEANPRLDGIERALKLLEKKVSVLNDGRLDAESGLKLLDERVAALEQRPS